MGIYAKSRRRLKYVNYVAIIEDGNGGYESIMLFKQGKLLLPTGTSNFSTLAAAKRDGVQQFDIHDDDWSELPDGLIAEPQEGAVEELQRKFDEFQSKPWESDAIVPCSAACTPATTRQYKRLLVGVWRFGKYELSFGGKIWSLSFDGEMLIRPLSILDKFAGPYSCTQGWIGLMSGLRGAPLNIARLDESNLVLTDGSLFTGTFKKVGPNYLNETTG